MFLVRWLPTFFAFPIGGLVAVEAVGSLEGPITAALGALLVGAVIGVAQWLALRSHGITSRWAFHTATGTAAGGAIAAVVTGASTAVGGLVVTGLIAGAVVGAAQATQLRRGRRVASAWTAVVSLAWGLGWLTTANVIVDAERGYYSFGASGALVVTLVTGVALHRILADRRPLSRGNATTTVALVATAPR
jgi:FtsH-binding integral membrane protein